MRWAAFSALILSVKLLHIVAYATPLLEAGVTQMDHPASGLTIHPFNKASSKPGGTGKGEDGNTDEDGGEDNDEDADTDDSNDDKMKTNKTESVSNKSSSSSKRSSKTNSSTEDSKKGEKVSGDDIIDELLRPSDSSSTTTKKPFVKPKSGQSSSSSYQRKGSDRETNSEGCDSESSSGSVKKSLKDLAKAGHQIGETIRGALKNMEKPMKGPGKDDIKSSSRSCMQSKSKALDNGSSSSESDDFAEFSGSTRSVNGPVSGSSSSSRKHRRSLGNADEIMRSLTAKHKELRKVFGKQSKHNFTIHGGVITKGKVTPSPPAAHDEDVEDDDEADHSGSSSESNNETSQSSGEQKDESSEKDEGKSRLNSEGNNSEGKNKSKGDRTNSRVGSRNRNVHSSKAMRDVTWTVSSSGAGQGSSSTLGSSYGIPSSVSSAFNTMSKSEASGVELDKPGRCRTLSGGMRCMSTRSDATQCTSDSGCPGSKKCCFYGCAPYSDIGMCEYPVMFG